MVSVLLEYIKYGECSIRVITSMVSVLLEYIDRGKSEAPTSRRARWW